MEKQLLPILKYPDKRLRLIAEPVEDFDPFFQQLVENLFETMYENNGVGLAAPQVNVQKRIIVLDASKEYNEPLCLVNPEIIDMEGSFKDFEGCLSFPGIYEKVERATWIAVKAQDRHGNLIELEAEGLLGHCIQHEVDHLNGHLFIDKLSALKRSMLDKKIAKQRARNF